MKNCTDCKHAHWQKTAAGKLHPSGNGRCQWELKLPALPTAIHWWAGVPRVSYGFINRRKELAVDCPQFASAE